MAVVAASDGAPGAQGLAEPLLSGARREFLDTSWPIMSRKLQKIGESMKGQALDDRDIPAFVESMASSFLDHVWADVTTEIKRGVEAAFVRSDFREMAVKRSREKAGPVADSRWQAPLYWLRRVVLFHFLPCDKTIFGKLKDPVYLMFYAITCIPLHGVRPLFFLVVFVSLVFPGPPDEFQIINFILLLKGSQFLTSGLIRMAAGSMKYFWCYSRYRYSGDALLQCLDTSGPGEGEAWGLAADYLGSTLLVYSACALLLRLETRKDVAGQAEPNDQEKKAGGRLRGLVYYDIMCFAASIFLLATITVWNVLMSRASDWWPQLCANVFWCYVLYSVLSMPFFFFTIPGLQTLLTHCDTTGYNVHGACVLWQPLPKKETKPEAEAAADPLAGSPLQDWHYRRGAWLLDTLERGRNRRPQVEQANQVGYTAMDFFRGLNSRGSGSSLERPREERLSTHAAAWRRRKASADSEAVEAMRHADLLGNFAPLDSVRILMEHRHKDLSGRTLHCVQVTPAPIGSLDEAGSPEPWLVFRYHTDFQELARSLGPQAESLDNVKLPPRMRTMTSQMRLDRNDGLERWLQAVVHASFRAPTEEQHDWGCKVAAFLAQSMSDRDIEALRLREEDDSPDSSDGDERRTVGPDSSGDPRHDFGVSFRHHHCADCQAMTWNRGCSQCELRLCRKCFLQHNCLTSSTSFERLLEAGLALGAGGATSCPRCTYSTSSATASPELPAAAHPGAGVLEKQAVENYERFHRLPPGSATLDQVVNSSAGVAGWARSLPGAPEGQPAGPGKRKFKMSTVVDQRDDQEAEALGAEAFRAAPGGADPIVGCPWRAPARAP